MKHRDREDSGRKIERMQKWDEAVFILLGSGIGIAIVVILVRVIGAK